MRAFVVSEYKGPLYEADVPEPVLGRSDVLVQVRAAGVNALDERIRAGEFKQILPYRLPQVLGNDVAGTVAAVGAEVRGFAPGDEVYTRPNKDRIGTFAERIAEETRETVNLNALHNMQGVTIDKVRGNEGMQLDMRIGSRGPLHCGGAGKAMLAFLSRSEQETVYAQPLHPLTPHTIVDPRQLEDEIGRIRRVIQLAQEGITLVAIRHIVALERRVRELEAQRDAAWERLTEREARQPKMRRERVPPI